MIRYVSGGVCSAETVSLSRQEFLEAPFPNQQNLSQNLIRSRRFIHKDIGEIKVNGILPSILL